MTLHAEVCVVTGANRGLGLAIAEGLARGGATVVLACRDPDRGAEAAAGVGEAAGHDRVFSLLCDLADPTSVDAFATEVMERFDRIDVLVNNAGLSPLDRRVSALGVELGWHISHLGHYQLTRRLIPRLVRSAPARIITLAGQYQRRGELRLDDLGWRRRPWDWGQAAADAQLARVLFTVGCAARLADTGVTANAVHPGAVRTRAQDVFPAHVRLLLATVLRPVFVSPRRGAKTVLRLAEDSRAVQRHRAMVPALSGRGAPPPGGRSCGPSVAVGPKRCVDRHRALTSSVRPALPVDRRWRGSRPRGPSLPCDDNEWGQPVRSRADRSIGGLHPAPRRRFVVTPDQDIDPGGPWPGWGGLCWPRSSRCG